MKSLNAALVIDCVESSISRRESKHGITHSYGKTTGRLVFKPNFLCTMFVIPAGNLIIALEIRMERFVYRFLRKDNRTFSFQSKFPFRR